MKSISSAALSVALAAVMCPLSATAQDATKQSNAGQAKDGEKQDKPPVDLPFNFTSRTAETNFSACDGFGPPQGKSDGISRESFLFGAATRSADLRRKTMWRFGKNGVESCDIALADPRLLDAFWLRRANLLQAKAVHAIAAGNPADAMKYADESDAIGRAQKDPYFPQSLGLGNQAVRAYALHQLGRNDEAATMTEQLRIRRQWSQSVANLSTRLKMQIDSSFAGQAAEFRARIPIDPARGRSLFWMEFLAGDYDAALGVAPTISFDLPKQRGGWTLRGADMAELKEIGLRTSFSGARAYAAAATGRSDEAKRLIAEAGAELEEIIAPPPPRENGKPPRKQDVEMHSRRLPYATRAKQDLQRWEAAIAFRPLIAFKPAEETQAAMRAKGLTTLPIITDVLRNVPQDTPEDKAAVAKVLAEIESADNKARVAALDLPVDDLMEMLPKPETAKVVPVLKPAGDGYFLSDTGLSRNREGKTDIWTIRYTHVLAPIAAVEELAMLGAAQTAQREGFDSMVVLSSVALSRTTNISGLYVGNYSQNSGYEAQLRVQFVNRGQLPADLGEQEWRLVPAAQVIAELTPRYREGGLTIAW